MKRILVLLAIAGAAAAAWVFLPRERLPEFVEWVRDRGPAGAAVLGLAYALATVLMIPGSLVTLAVGFIYGPWWGTVLVSPASVLGATLAFLLGRGLFRASLEERMGGNRRFQALQSGIARQGLRILILVRLSPVFPFVLLNYVFGLTRIPLSRYVLGSFVGMLPGTFMFVYLGSTMKDVADLVAGTPDAGAAGRWLKWAGLAATVVVTVLVTRAARRALAEEAPDALVEDGASGASA